jgi:hypothetical protein
VSGPFDRHNHDGDYADRQQADNIEIYARRNRTNIDELITRIDHNFHDCHQVEKRLELLEALVERLSASLDRMLTPRE